MKALMGLTLAAVAALLVAGCSAPAIHERTLGMQPGGRGFAEVNLVMQKGQAVSWDWQADGGELYFNVHGHAATGQATEHVAKTAAADTGSFAVPAAGSYSLLWENLGTTPVTLHYRITGDAALDPDHPPVP